MNSKIRQQLKRRNRTLRRRVSVKHGRWQSPMIRPSATKLEVSEKQHAVSCGGMAAILE